MENPLGALNHIKHAFDTDEAHYVQHFEVTGEDVVLDVVIRDGGVPAEPDRYYVTVLRDGQQLAEAGPEHDLPTALRNAHSKAKSHY